jgi:hypothetical protein
MYLTVLIIINIGPAKRPQTVHILKTRCHKVDCRVPWTYNVYIN